MVGTFSTAIFSYVLAVFVRLVLIQIVVGLVNIADKFATSNSLVLSNKFTAISRVALGRLVCNSSSTTVKFNISTVKLLQLSNPIFSTD